MDDEKILDKLSTPFISRLKIPIISTYISVLIIYNWDVLFYLVFEPIIASKKINFIKSNYSETYTTRIFESLGIAILILIIFTILNTTLNYLLKWFYKKDKKFSTEIENLQTVDILKEELSKQININEELLKKIQTIENINNNFLSKSINLKTDEISKNDYDKLINEISGRVDTDKLKFSLNELLDLLVKDIKLSYKAIISKSTYPESIESLFKTLEALKLVQINRSYSDPQIKFNKSMLDFINFRKQKNI